MILRVVEAVARAITAKTSITDMLWPTAHNNTHAVTRHRCNSSILRTWHLADVGAHSTQRRGLYNMQLKLPSRSPKWQHKYHQDPATICSAVNYRLQHISPRLASSLGMFVPSFSTLVLNHPLYSCQCDYQCTSKTPSRT